MHADRLSRLITEWRRQVGRRDACGGTDTCSRQAVLSVFRGKEDVAIHARIREVQSYPMCNALIRVRINRQGR